jgi:hypothetical protein
MNRIDSSGYYRVNYDIRNWRLLATQLLNSPPQDMLPATTRAQLLDDALNLARAGTLSYEVALNMTRYLATRESHYVPWKAVFENWRFLDFMLRQTPAYGVFQVLEAYYFLFIYLVYEAIGTAATPGLLCQPRVIVKMIVDKQMECRLAGENEVLGENLPQRQFCPSQNPT